jgi:hypothetical protein
MKALKVIGENGSID